MTRSPDSIKGLFILPAIIAAIFFAVSCKKDEFKGIDFKVEYEYDGQHRSFEEKTIYNHPDRHTLKVFKRNDTTFIYSPRHIWWDDHFFYGYFNVIDLEHSYLTKWKTEYELKPGVIYPEEANSKKEFTENVLLVYSAPRVAIEVIEGHCSVEATWKKSDMDITSAETNLVGVKVCFNAKWKEVESGEEHEIKNGEALYSSRIVNIDYRETTP